MREIRIGEYIKRRRQELGLLQKDVCEGICEPATLSRLENGKQTPSRNMVNALLERLDLPADRYFGLLRDNEAEIENLQEDIIALNMAFERSVEPEKTNVKKCAYAKISELEQLAGEDDKTTQQFILRTKALLGREDGGSYSKDEKLFMLMDAIHLTVPRFDLHHINNFLYCLEEVITINQIAGVYTIHGQHEKAAEIYGQLLEYVRNHYQNILKSRGHLPLVAFNYARVLNLCGRNEEALEAVELGWQACIDYRNYQMLPRIVHTMALIYHDLGNAEKSKELYCEAYYLCKVIDDQRGLFLLQQDAREQYGIEFEY